MGVKVNVKKYQRELIRRRKYKFCDVRVRVVTSHLAEDGSVDFMKVGNERRVADTKTVSRWNVDSCLKNTKMYVSSLCLELYLISRHCIFSKIF